MRRRELIFLLGGATTARPLAARAQRKAMPVIGFLSSVSPNEPRSFLEGLGATGYVTGQNVAIEYRWAEGHLDRLPALAADLVTRKVDVIVAAGGSSPALAAKQATATIPIVFTTVGTPVEIGLVASLARPGGNVTGFSADPENSLMQKRFELLTELVSQTKVFALLVNPDSRFATRVVASVEAAAHAKGMELRVVEARNKSEIDAAFATLVSLRAGALVVADDPFFSPQMAQLLALEARYAVPVMYFARGFVDAGGLISYSAKFVDLYRGAGVYVGRILKGEKPADLPVQQPTRFELVINLKTAQALGLTVPPALLARADEVIE
jgi:putative ABC transport system substrate-binding protein